ncbi:amino acid ABC transporter permease [Bulleidia sp. HCP3S3_F2]|jgi:polar amino acid transport system permease protein|uniref:amino acid ABC transporter permease n=1 Tax=unclassified Bulleidia TaxID=2704656 RepID=UPI002A8FF56E|nr:amino acid ABC transporter permease [Erysipelotrichaceae bacterium 7770_A6]MCI7724175.1 amino acid ABC transporter permease [Erysipelotrichaceae bacterium]MDY3659829.1 amino acid ABC transporter permease [Bulleidia sp.]MDD7058399.1 amino acid ABC transporter permease [Erysipelotrichaceae bacterium]MEE0559479.1 amino acid ABC transporter permease [Bulleidia sp.]
MFVAFQEVFTLANILYLAKGALLSIGIAALSLLFGLILGTLGATGKRSKHALPRDIANVYVTIIRGTPLLLQILIIFSVIPSMYTAITGKILRIDPLLIGVLAMSINSGAYQTELIRSGVNAVDKGQWEACETLGLSNWKTLKLVILPQAFKRIVPPLISEFITLIKDSSLISCIGAVELLKGAQIIGAQYFDVMSPYMLAAIFYLVMTCVVSMIGMKVEKRLSVSD